MTRVQRAAMALIRAIIWPLVELGSNRIFLAGIAIITILWILDAIFSPHPVDDWRGGLPRLVLWYTIWFGLVEGATKVVQADQAQRDHLAQQRQAAILENVSDLTLAIREEQDHTRDRDCAAAKRDEAQRVILDRILDALEREGGDPVHGAIH